MALIIMAGLTIMVVAICYTIYKIVAMILTEDKAVREDNADKRKQGR